MSDGCVASGFLRMIQYDRFMYYVPDGSSFCAVVVRHRRKRCGTGRAPWSTLSLPPSIPPSLRRVPSEWEDDGSA